MRGLPNILSFFFAASVMNSIIQEHDCYFVSELFLAILKLSLCIKLRRVVTC